MADNDISSVILAEIRDLRKDFTAFSLDVTSRVAALEQSSKALIGNGRPGKIQELETGLREVQRWMWMCFGGGTVVSVGLTVALHFVGPGK